MFATLRRYHTKEGAASKESIEQLRRQLHDDFLPIIQNVPGFHGYYALNVEDKELITISICETRSGTDETTRHAAEFVKQNPMPVELDRPEVTDAEVLTFAEAAREVGAH